MTCDGGEQQRTKTISQHQEGTGQACYGTVEVRPCNTDECPMACAVASWGVWTTCTSSCGNGSTKFRARGVTVQQQGTGATCPYTSEQASCLEECPVDCATSAWTSWAPCFLTCTACQWIQIVHSGFTIIVGWQVVRRRKQGHAQLARPQPLAEWLVLP